MQQVWHTYCSSAAPQGAGAQQSHSLVTASLFPHTPRSCAIASLPTLLVQTMLEHLTTRKPAGVCTDLFNHLLIACTLTALKHLKATNTAFPLSSTPFEGQSWLCWSSSLQNKPNAENAIMQEFRHLSPLNTT